MKYEEIEDWKKLAKEEKYEEATKSLLYEIGMNLMRVHNLYSDVKYDEKEKWYLALDYSFFSKGVSTIEINKYETICLELDLINIGVNSEFNNLTILRYYYKKAMNFRKLVRKYINVIKVA